MGKLKALCRRLFCLPPGHILAASVPLFALVGTVLALGVRGPLAWAAYLGSAWALIACLTHLPGLAGAAARRLRISRLARWWAGTALGRRLQQDGNFRLRLSMHAVVTMNLGYILLKLITGLYYRSLWFLSLAVYYALLMVQRVLLLRYVELGGEKGLRAELVRYRRCGVLLLLMNQVLAVVVAIIVRNNRTVLYPDLLLYGMAAYAFFAVASAVVGLVHSHRRGGPVRSAAKVLDLVAAAVSLLSLQTAMLARFGRGEEAVRAVMTAVTGSLVCVLIIVIAVVMIFTANRHLKQLDEV